MVLSRIYIYIVYVIIAWTFHVFLCAYISCTQVTCIIYLFTGFKLQCNVVDTMPPRKCKAVCVSADMDKKKTKMEDKATQYIDVSKNLFLKFIQYFLLNSKKEYVKKIA